MFKSFLYSVFGYVFNINLSLIKKKNNSKLIYSNQISFGDFFTFNVLNYDLIMSKKKKLIIFTKFEKKIANLFFPEDKIHRSFMLLPNFFPVYRLNGYLRKDLQYEKILTQDTSKITYKNNYKKLLNNILYKGYNNISSNVKFFKNKKFVLVFVKHHNKNCDGIIGSESRQTSDINKIFLILKFILKKKYKIIILGNKKDKSINLIENYFKNKNLFFFKNLSADKTLHDQLFLHKYSQFGIGSESGAWIMSHFFQKKLILFDGMICKENDSFKKHSNVFFMPKKIKYKNKLVPQTLRIINQILKYKIPYSVVEVSFIEIIEQLKKVFLQKSSKKVRIGKRPILIS
jgi:hypothetical protein